MGKAQRTKWKKNARPKLQERQLPDVHTLMPPQYPIAMEDELDNLTKRQLRLLHRMSDAGKEFRATLDAFKAAERKEIYAAGDAANAGVSLALLYTIRKTWREPRHNRSEAQGGPKKGRRRHNRKRHDHGRR